MENLCELCGRPKRGEEYQMMYCFSCFKFSLDDEATIKFAKSHVCATCGKIALMRCSRCRDVLYCSKSCQMDDWNRHSIECDGSQLCGLDIPERPRSCMRKDLRWGMFRDIPLTREFFMNTEETTELGKGAFGRVVAMKNPHGEVAVKLSPIKRMSIKNSMMHEMEVRNFDDPNVIGICSAGFTATEFGFAMDIAYGDLSKLTTESTLERMDKDLKGTFSPEEMKILTYQIIRGTAAIHSRLVINFDIKFGNILVFPIEMMSRESSEYLKSKTFKQLQIADFGDSLGGCVFPFIMTNRGTKTYMAPELVFGRDVLGTFANDVWSAACTIFKMATRRNFIRSYDSSDASSVFEENFGTDVFLDTTHTTPKERNMMTLENRPWFPKFKSSLKHREDTHREILERELKIYPGLASLLYPMFEPIPQNRCTIFESLRNPYFDDITRHIVNSTLACKDPVPMVFDKSTLSVEPHYAMSVMLKDEEMRYFSMPRKVNVDESFFESIALKISELLEIYRKNIARMHMLDEVESKARMFALRYLSSTKTDRDTFTIAAACCVTSLKYLEVFDPKEMLKPGEADIVDAFTSSMFSESDFDFTGYSWHDFARLYVRNDLKLLSRINAFLREVTTRSNFLLKYKPSFVAAMCCFKESSVPTREFISMTSDDFSKTIREFNDTYKK